MRALFTILSILICLCWLWVLKMSSELHMTCKLLLANGSSIFEWPELVFKILWSLLKYKAIRTSTGLSYTGPPPPASSPVHGLVRTSLAFITNSSLVLTFSPYPNSHCLYKLVNGALLKINAYLSPFGDSLSSKSLSLKSAEILHMVQMHNRNVKPSVWRRLTVQHLSLQALTSGPLCLPSRRRAVLALLRFVKSYLRKTYTVGTFRRRWVRNMIQC